MIKIQNISKTLFRWQEFIWRPGEVLTFNIEGHNKWEENLGAQLLADYKNLIDVTNSPRRLSPAELKALRIANLAKGRATRKAKREQSHKTA